MIAWLLCYYELMKCLIESFGLCLLDCCTRERWWALVLSPKQARLA